MPDVQWRDAADRVGQAAAGIRPASVVRALGILVACVVVGGVFLLAEATAFVAGAIALAAPGASDNPLMWSFEGALLLVPVGFLLGVVLLALGLRWLSTLPVLLVVTLLVANSVAIDVKCGGYNACGYPRHARP